MDSGSVSSDDTIADEQEVNVIVSLGNQTAVLGGSEELAQPLAIAPAEQGDNCSVLSVTMAAGVDAAQMCDLSPPPEGVHCDTYTDDQSLGGSVSPIKFEYGLSPPPEGVQCDTYNGDTTMLYRARQLCEQLMSAGCPISLVTEVVVVATRAVGRNLMEAAEAAMLKIEW